MNAGARVNGPAGHVQTRSGADCALCGAPSVEQNRLDICACNDAVNIQSKPKNADSSKRTRGLMAGRSKSERTFSLQ